MKRWIKRISFMILCFLCLFTLYSYNTVIALETNTVTITFDNNNTIYDSEYFTVSLDRKLEGGKLTVGDTSDGNVDNDENNFITVTSKTVAAKKYYISSIKVNGELEKLICSCDLDTSDDRDGIIDYTSSLIEYINGATSATLKADSDATIESIEVTYTDTNNEYIVLNLAAGSSSIYSTTCAGYNLLNKYVSQVSTTGKQIYIVQTEILANGNLTRYTSYVNGYAINFGQNYKITTTLVLDNLWSSYTSGDNGGLHVPVNSSAYAKNIIVRLKGINRFTRISYWASSSHNSSLKFTSFDGDGSTNGTLIAIGKQTTKSNSVHGTLSLNGWNSVIGGSDANQETYGLKFAGGTILAVATARDQCTAIGAGGNGGANIEISGGSVTAISYTTGTAIGGGIGHLSAGGSATVKITGGEVHAYNLGQPYALTCSSADKKAYRFVPGTAIGGASSYQADGNQGTVIIEGGEVYAYSNGGSGLGGGNSIQGVGGSANINISDGDVTSYGYIPEEEANKIYNIITELKNEILSVIPNGLTSAGISDELIYPFDYGSDGSGIGGGSSRDKNGGTATITINGGYLDASSIGGGNSQKAKGASATVNVNDGTIRCETIGGGFSDANGFADGTVTVKGGSLNATMSALPTNGLTSEMLYLTRISILDNNELPIIKGMIESLDIDNANYYGSSHMYTDEEGMIYLWLPKNAAVRLGQITDGSMSSPLAPWEEADGVIGAYEIGILKVTNSDSYNYYVNTVTSEYYHLYNKYDSSTDVLSKELENTTIVPNNTLFSIYIDVLTGYTINAYYAVESSSGKKTFEKAITSTIKENKLYSLSITITQNTSILFEIMGPENIPHYFIMDLYNGNINITEGSTGYIIEQNGYVLTGYNGDIYATSGGIATSNNISVEIEDDSEIGLFLNNIIIGSDDYCVGVHSGKVNLTTGSVNDIIHSNNNSAIFVEENAVIEITTDKDDALQLYSGDKNISPISGKGKVIFNNQGGYFQIKTDGNIPQISVGIYEVNGKGSFSAELFIDEFEFELIGYIDSVNNLHSVAEAQTGNHDNFAARGIYKVLNGVKVTSQKVENNKFYITISTIDSGSHDLGVIELTCNGTPLLENNASGYSIDEATKTADTCTIVIEGAAFENGNIMVFAAVIGVIPYQLIDFNGVYDANAHTISIAINLNMFTVYYSDTVELDSTNYLANGSTTLPTYTDVTNPDVTIYIYICKSTANLDGLEYTPVQDQATVTITKGTNEWKSQLVCPDVAKGYSPKPTAASKWGIVEYIYYDSNDEVLSDGFDFTVAALGTYYVEAIVTGNQNYDTIKTSYKIRFKIIEVMTFADDLRTLTKISGTNLSLQIKLNGEFTVLYAITYAAGLKLNVSNTDVDKDVASLPVGTKITFIDFSVDVNGGNIKYYYYIIQNEDIINANNISIPLTKFIQMGTDNQKFVAPAIDTAVEYQFAIDFGENHTEDSGEIKFTLADNNAQTYDVVNVNFSSNPNENIKYVKGGNGNEVVYDLTINADDSNADKALIIDLSSNSNLNGLDVKLYNAGRLMTPNEIINGMYFYDLTSENISGRVYQLVLTNLFTDDKTLDIEFDIRNTYTDILYSLNNQNSSNHEEDSVTLAGKAENKISVEVITGNNNEELIVTENNTNLYLSINTTLPAIQTDSFKLVLYVKTPNGIIEYPLEAPLTISQNDSDQLYVALPNLENNTYIIEFRYMGAIDKISFVVKK